MSIVEALKFGAMILALPRKVWLEKLELISNFMKGAFMLHLSVVFTTPSIGFVKSCSHVAAPSEESLVFSTTRGNYL